MIDKICADLDVSRETQARLQIYADLLARWQARINLISPTTLPYIWQRHFMDSLQLRRLAPEAAIWLDMGSGAGFPGLVLAIAMGDEPAGKTLTHVHLVESNSKKCAFLREVARETGVEVTIHNERIEVALPQFFSEGSRKLDIITARAVSSLSQLLDYSYLLLTSPTRALFLKGQDVEVELTEAAKCWNLSYKLHPSLSHPESAIVEIHRASKKVQGV